MKANKVDIAVVGAGIVGLAHALAGSTGIERHPIRTRRTPIWGFNSKFWLALANWVGTYSFTRAGDA